MSGLENICYMSIAFDELSTETKVVHCNLVVFKKGSSAVLQVRLEYNDNKEWLKVSWIIGRLVVYWVGVIMRLILKGMIFI